VRFVLSDFEAVLPAAISRIHWVGASSFEERCTASLACLRRANIKIVRSSVIEYDTDVRPRNRARTMITDNRKRMHRLLGSSARTPVAIPSYRYIAFLAWLTELGDSEGQPGDIDALVIDVSCLTKLHAVALCRWLTATKLSFPIVLAYSSPKDYHASKSVKPTRGRWKDLLVAPVVSRPLPDLRENSGVLIPGHEGDRLRLALDEVVANRGLVIEAEARELRVAVASQAQNSFLYDRIEGLHGSDFELVSVDIAQMRSVQSAVRKVVKAARECRSKLTIYPMGPKPLVLGAVAEACSSYSLGTWYVYPVPSYYRATYTHGVAETLWSTVSPSGTRKPVSAVLF
jgi:hypothetical protein